MKTTLLNYDDFLENRIERCLERALSVHLKTGCSRRRAERAVQEATFYSACRQQLLRAMELRHIAASQDAVDQFLMEAYTELPIDN